MEPTLTFGVETMLLTGRKSWGSASFLVGRFKLYEIQLLTSYTVCTLSSQNKHSYLLSAGIYQQGSA